VGVNWREWWSHLEEGELESSHRIPGAMPVGAGVKVRVLGAIAGGRVLSREEFRLGKTGSINAGRDSRGDRPWVGAGREGGRRGGRGGGGDESLGGRGGMSAITLP